VCAGTFASVLHAQGQFPVGTAIAVALDQSLDSRTCKPGERVVGHVAQEVPLGRRVIRVGSKIFGQVTQVENGRGLAKLGVRFERLDVGGERVAISVKARAAASPVLAENAGRPTNAATSPGSWTIALVGNDAVYGVGGPVQDEMDNVVGKAVRGGVMVKLRNQPGSMCEGIPLSDQPQPAWVFSASACGVYGLGNLQLANGTEANAGEILFNRRNKHEDKQTTLKVPAGTALLLAITEAPAQ
jgi:hypothetical protein